MRSLFQILLYAVGMSGFAQDAVTLVDCPFFYSANETDSLPARGLSAGTGLSVTGVSSIETAADHEGRVFHWFHVEDVQGQEGWVRGYELATAWAAESLPESIKQKNATELALHRDFGVSKLWFAAIRTIDLDNQDGSSFVEYYLVLGNSSGRQLFHPLGTQHAQGSTQTKQLCISDINLDSKPDLLIVKHSVPVFGEQVWQLEAITVNQGRWMNLLDLPITIQDVHGDIAPTIARFVEFDGDRVRIESIEYESCTPTENITISNESCLNYRVETLRWNAAKQQFLAWYPVAVTEVQASVLAPVLLRDKPHSGAKTKTQIPTGTQLIVEAVAEEYQIIQGKKRRVTWYRVHDEQNQVGYVEGKMLDFSHVKHGKILEAWHSGLPLTVFDFVPEVHYLQIRS